ncbi:MAG: ATP-binding protein [Acidimicrobiia bacterium]
MSSRGEPGRANLTTRLLFISSLASLVIVLLLPLLVDRSIRAITTRVALLLSLVALGGLALMSRRLARRLSDLADQANSIAGGDLDAAPERSPVAEVDRLGLALSEIARDLGGRVTDAEQAAAMLEVVLGAMPQGIVLFDGDRVIYANPAAGQILGAVLDTLGGLTPLQLQSAVREARGGEQPVSRVVDHGGPARRLRGTATPFVGDDRVMLVVADITESERTDTIRRDFAANASHELKTPVATIIAASEALQIALSRGDPSAEGFASQVESSARQLDRLVADLLDLSRLEKETPELAPVRFDLVVGEELEKVEGRVSDNDLTMVANLEEALVVANSRDLGIAVHNLLDNAIRHTPGGGKVTVVLETSSGRAVLTVADTGEGIPSRDLERVFERFYRVDSARSRGTGGTGLGLAIVRHVAESHGGEVSLQSELGRGSSFEVWLPLGDGEASGAN